MYIRYSLCLLAFKINKQQRDFSEIRLLVIQNAFKWPAEESDHHRVCAEGEYSALPIGNLARAVSSDAG